MEQSKEPAKDGKKHKKLNIIFNIISCVFFAICFLVLILILTAKKTNDGALSLFQHQFRLVISPSMEKCEQTDVSKFTIKDIPVRSMVIVEEVPKESIKRDLWFSKLEVGDVLTFRYVYTKQETITHRIVKIIEKPSGGWIFHLEGDNKADSGTVLTQIIDTSEEDSPNYVIGKVVGVSRFLGYIMFVLKQPVGLICVIIIPCSIIIIWQILRIVFAFTSDAKQKKDKEIEELKKQLADIKKEQGENGVSHEK